MGTLPRNKTGVQQYDEAKLGFGDIFTEHMLTIKYSVTDGGWETPQIVKTENLSLHPGAMILHYGQQVFEGLKAFAGPKDEDILLFRPDMNIARFNKSCERMCIPTLDPKIFMAQMAELLRKDRDWIPRAAGTSLYIRPTVIAIDSHLGVRPSKTYLFYIIMSPVGAYYPEGFEPVKIMVTDKYVRAADRRSRGGKDRRQLRRVVVRRRRQRIGKVLRRSCGLTPWTSHRLKKSAP